MIFSLFFSLTAQAAVNQLSMSGYLDQVNGKSPSTIAARLHAEGGESRANGANVLTFPYLFGSLSALDDQAQPAFPAVQGTETKANVYTVGVGVNTPWGLNGKYSWNTGFTNVIGITFPSIGNYTSYNKIDLTLNLAHNGFGSEITSRQALICSGNEAQSLAGQYQLVGKLAEAEGAYWRLALARQAVLVDRDTLARSEKLLEWAKRRVSLQLGDRSDLLQAQATYDLHNIELSTAMEEARNSARAFNLLRNQDGDNVEEAVGFPSIDETLRMATPAREGERLDVQAAAEKTKAAQAQSQLDKELLKPNVDVVASYAWNGRDLNRSS
ncbi:MAG: TolC family protein, partial [Bdellovibrionota bacterium]